MRLAGSEVWFVPVLTKFDPRLSERLLAKRRGHGWNRNPLNSLGAGGRNRTVDLLITNQMTRQDNYLIFKCIFSTACTLPAGEIGNSR